MTCLSVYVGEYDTYVIPAHLLRRATSANTGKSLADRRTKGNQILTAWGKSKDAQKAKKYLSLLQKPT